MVRAAAQTLKSVSPEAREEASVAVREGDLRFRPETAFRDLPLESVRSGHRPGERAALMAEEFAFQQRGGNRGAIEATNRFSRRGLDS